MFKCKLISQCLTLSRGMSFASCTFKSITILDISAESPLTLKVSGKLPRNLPDTLNGLSLERSGIWEGSTYWINSRYVIIRQE